MGYVLYGGNGTGSFTAEALLAEIGTDVEVRAPDLDDPKRAAEYRRVNPMGRLPALVLPDGTVVTESAAVLLAIADRHPEAELMPDPGSAAQAVALRWIVFLATNVYEAVGRYDFPARYTTSADADAHAAIRAQAKKDLRRFLVLVERHLAPDPHALGARFSALDVYLANLSRWIVGREWRARQCPRIDEVARLVAARPRIAPVWTRHWGA